jgi:DNA gyrase subunit A
MDIGKVQKREITEEMRESYLDYAMSVIVARALPDVRDGLKPVHRRILFSMHEMGLRANAKLVKSARIVGDTLGRYHPHGDVALYDALVRMAQPFSLRYPLVKGQGNFGSVDGDSAAAMRYTEAKLTAIAEELLVDIEKNTVEFQANYDASRSEPKVLPARIPNLLLNGSVGIAVGMATNIPPHNLGEVVDALIHLLRHPDASVEDLTRFIQGPDFPGGGVIYDRKAILEAYATGRGSILARGKAEIVERKTRSTRSGRESGFDVLISEIPFEVNKAELIGKIAELTEGKRVEGIRTIRDESDKEGTRIVIELKNDAQPQRVLNALFKLTDLEKPFHLNMLALVDGLQPQTLSLRGVLEEYLKHRKLVVTRRTEFELEKTKARVHILEGLARALEKIDAVIKTIRASANRDQAKTNLMKSFFLSEKQAEAILEMRLESLAKLEREKILSELKEKQKLAKELAAILKDPKLIIKVMEEEFSELKQKYGDKRRTNVEANRPGEISDEELIPEGEAVISLSQSNYIKRMSPDAFKLQRRGGKGVIGFETKTDEDTLKLVTAANTHDELLSFSNFGRAFSARVFEIPEASRLSRGKPVHNFLNLLAGEEIAAMVSLRKEKRSQSGQCLILATENGIIKKTSLEEFRNLRRGGTRAIALKKGDSLRWAALSSGSDEILLISRLGQAIRFSEKQARPLGRVSAGVQGMRLKKDDSVVGMGVIAQGEKQSGPKADSKVLVVTEKGFGKLTPIKAYRLQRRGGVGIKTARISDKGGVIVAARIIAGEEELISVSKKGQTIRMPLSAIPTQGRATQGVRIMKLAAGDTVAAITCI